MAEFSRKEASGAVILLKYMSGKLQGLRDNEFTESSAPRALNAEASPLAVVNY